MTNIEPRPAPDDDPNRAMPGGGGWISGSSITTGQPLGSEVEAGTRRHAADRRPQYNPAALVLDVKAALTAAGVDVDPGPNEMHVASLAAADLLRALGVRPANAPQRTTGGRRGDVR